MSPPAGFFRTIRLSVAVTCIAGLILAYCMISRAESSPSPHVPPGMVITTPYLSSEITGALRTIHEKMSQGVTPENNAAVWLVHIYGEDAFEPQLHDVTLEMLGIQTASPTSPLFVSVGEYVNSLEDIPAEKAAEQSNLVESQLLQGCGELWTAKEFPQLAGYLTANENALAALTIAADRPRYFAPLLAPELPSRLMSASLVMERRLPFLARLLAARALLRFDQQNFSGSLNDLMACHRLACLLAAGSPFDVSVAKAQVIDSTAFQAEKALLESGRLTAGQLADFRRLFATIPPFPPASQAADLGERAIIHQEIELLRSDKDSKIGFFEESDQETVDPKQIESLAESNWELAFQRADEIQDTVVAALATKERETQRKMFLALDQAYANWEATVDQKTRTFSSEVKKDRPGISRWIGENMAMSLRPNAYQRRASEDRLDVRRNLITVGLALEAYQREQQSFPATLADLVPRYLPSVPLDACTDAPFVYFPQDGNQARLMSLGTNRVDDAGENYNDDVELKLR